MTNLIPVLAINKTVPFLEEPPRVKELNVKMKHNMMLGAKDSDQLEICS